MASPDGMLFVQQAQQSNRVCFFCGAAKADWAPGAPCGACEGRVTCTRLVFRAVQAVRL